MPDSAILVRVEEPADSAAISEVLTLAFGQTAEAELVARLRSNGHLSLSLVATLAGGAVGHVAFSPVSTAGEAATIAGLGLAPLALRPAFQRQGIGSLLVRAGLERCRQAGVGFVVVLGSPGYYGRFGFTPARQHGIRNAYTDGDEFQLLELLPGAAPGAGALVLYGPEFAPWG